MDRYGREEFDRGYRKGRDERSEGSRYDRYGDRSWWEDYERGYRRGREDERRYGFGGRRDD